MAKQAKKSLAEIPTIDVCLVTIETQTGEFGFDTANQISVETQVEEQDAVKLVVKGVLRAQKKATSTITGTQITLTDNVFNPELVKVMQGGKIILDEGTQEIIGYEPPVAGSADKGETFILNAYSAQYDGAGTIVRYEKISYPNCTGVPVAFSSEDDAFRAPEYTINSAPNTGEPPYRISYVKDLPILVDEYTDANTLVVESVAGSESGKTKITVTPGKEEYTDKYYYTDEIDGSSIDENLKYGTKIVGYIPWDGQAEIEIESGRYIYIIETDENDKLIAYGKTQTVINGG